MTQEHFNVEDLNFNSNNFIGWLRLFLELNILTEEYNKRIRKYIERTDVVRRKKELEDIFGW